jgi:hypothetical protein
VKIEMPLILAARAMAIMGSMDIDFSWLSTYAHSQHCNGDLGFVAISTGTVPFGVAYARESRVGIRLSARKGWRAAFDVTTCLGLTGESGRPHCAAHCVQ